MSDAVEEEVSVVIDAGSGTVCAGFSGDEAPRAVFPTIVGKARQQAVMEYFCTSDVNNRYVGDIPENDRGVVSMRYPIERGIITSWDDMEKIWHDTFYNWLRAAPQDRPVLVTEPPFNPKKNRETMAEIMFEKLDVSAFFVSLQPTLAMTASGRHGGVVVDIGEGVTHITPIMGVYSWPHAIKRTHMAGKDLTEYLNRLLKERGHYFETSAEMEIVRDLKEKRAYVASDFDQEMKTSETSSELECKYELPDGNVITIGNERFRCAEALFNPALIGREHPGIDELVYNTIMATDINVRSHFYSNIILTGGTTLLPGIQERLKSAMIKLVPPSMKVNVVAVPERKYLTWIGGSILASLSTFRKIYITRAEYDESGPSITHQKCA